MINLKKKYIEKVIPEMMKKFGYKNVMAVPKVEKVIITSSHGQIIKLPLKNIPQMGRATQGVIMMRFARKSDQVAATAVLEKNNEPKQ